MNHLKGALAAFVAVFFVAACIAPAPVASAQSSAALSIVPKKNYTIEPGKSVKDKLTIRNLDDKHQLELTLRVVDFTFMDDGGAPKLMLDENAEQTSWSLKPFLTVPKTVKIPPKTSKTLDMNVSIPAKHGAGSYYSAIVYSSGTPEGGNVGLSASGVTLVFASIPGKVNEDLKLERFGAYKPAKGEQTGDYMFFTIDEPQNVAYTLKNNGNVTAAAVGTITLKDMFGKEYVINDVNPNESLALIGQTRTYSACIKLKAQEVEFEGEKSETKACTSPGLWPGYYGASLHLFYGQNGNSTQEIVSTSSFWYMPIWFIILLLVLLAAIAYGVWRIVRIVKGKTGGAHGKKSLRRSK